MVPSVRARSPCGWTERWRTPSDPHSAPPEGQTPSAGVGGTFHWIGSLHVTKKRSIKINLDLNGYLLTYIGFCGVYNQVTGLCAWRFVFISNILYVVTNFNSVSIYSYNKHFS